MIIGAKSKELIDILNCEVGKNWHGNYNENELLPTLTSAFEYLYRYINYYNKHNKTSINNLSDRQILMANTTLNYIINKEYKSAYHDLWDCIDDMGQGSKTNNVINYDEFIIYKLLIQFFINNLQPSCCCSLKNATIVRIQNKLK